MIDIVYADPKFTESYNQAVGSVARERKYLANIDGFPIESSRQFVNFIVEKNLPQYYAVTNSKVIAWCDVIPKSPDLMCHVGVLGMGVLLENRHQGFGQKLLDIVIEHAKSIGLEKIELEVFSTNQVAIAFYEKHGFIYEGRRIKALKIDNRYDDLIQMGKFLE